MSRLVKCCRSTIGSATTSLIPIGKMYNVTDNAVRKWCDFYKLPRRKTDIKAISDQEWSNL